MTSLSTITLSPGLRFVKVPGFPKAQNFLSYHKELAHNKDEFGRIDLARKLFKVWDQSGIVLPQFGVPARDDYWYLAQIYFFGRHIHADGSKYIFDISKEEEIIIEDFPEKDQGHQFGALFNELQTVSLKTSQLQKNAYSRKDVDELLERYGDDVLKNLKVDPQYFKLSHIPFDIFIRLSEEMNFDTQAENTFFDGYRHKLDGSKTGFFGGNTLFGGASFIDSFDDSLANTSIHPRFVIIRKNYGR